MQERATTHKDFLMFMCVQRWNKSTIVNFTLLFRLYCLADSWWKIKTASRSWNVSLLICFFDIIVLRYVDAVWLTIAWSQVEVIAHIGLRITLSCCRTIDGLTPHLFLRFRLSWTCTFRIDQKAKKYTYFTWLCDFRGRETNSSRVVVPVPCTRWQRWYGADVSVSVAAQESWRQR